MKPETNRTSGRNHYGRDQFVYDFNDKTELSQKQNS